MSQWKPDLGEFLYKHPQLKNSLLNQTIVLMNTKFVFKKETEGFEVICVMPFPGVSQREEEVYLIVLRFPLEMDVNKLQQALENSYVSFQIIGLGKSSNLLPGKKYRPLSVIWVDTGKNLEEFVPTLGTYKLGFII
jgi:gamma-glutamylcyclotransferase (GGCT)/AIG2-like uncharacterized protein YtfP